MFKLIGRYLERVFCIIGLIELLYFLRILFFSKDILIFSFIIFIKNFYSLVLFFGLLFLVLYFIYLVWWSRIGDIVVVRFLFYYRKYKLEFFFDFFIYFINCCCWLIF